MFLLNSCLGLFSAAPSRGRPFSRSYGAILPSSLAVLLPSALGSSPHPPVSVCGTGAAEAIAAFLGRRSARFATPSSLRVARAPARACPGLPSPGPRHAPASPHLLSRSGTGISTCCPSATPSGLALGPDLPRADQLYPGNLGYSAGRIPTFLSLLIPAFSLRCGPPPLAVRLPPASNAPLPAARTRRAAPKLRRRVSAPDIFGAGPLG